MEIQNRVIILILILSLVGCSKNTNHFVLFSKGNKYEIKNYKFYKSKSNSIFVEMNKKTSNISLDTISIDSMLYITSNSKINLCKVKQGILNNYCDLFYMVDKNNEKLVRTDNKSGNKFIFIVGNDIRVRKNMKTDTISKIPIEYQEAKN